MQEPGQGVELTYIKEVTRGVTPGAPTMNILRATGRNINTQKTTLQSQEVNRARQLIRTRHGFESVLGTPSFELAMQDYDDFLEAAMGSAWTAGADTGAVSLDVDDADTFGNLDYAAGGFEVGDIIDSSGFTNAENNGRFRVTAVTAADMDVVNLDGSAPGLTTETGGGDEQIQVVGNKVKNGTTLDTFTIERGFTQTTRYQIFRGVAVNGFSVSIQPDQVASGSWDLIGMSNGGFSGASLDGTPIAVQGTAPFDGFTGAMFEGGSVIGIVTGVDFQLANNRALQAVLFSAGSPDVFEGQPALTGTVTALFEDATLVDKFLNETVTALQITFDELGTTEFMSFHFPTITYNGGDMDPPQTGPVLLTMPFNAHGDIVIQKSN